MEKLAMLLDIILVSILSVSMMLIIATMNGNKKSKAICIMEAFAWLCVVVRMVLDSAIIDIVLNLVVTTLLILICLLEKRK